MPDSPLPWIRCDERLPETTDDVLVCSRTGDYGVGYYDPYIREWIVRGAEPTHWLPLTPPR